MNNKRKAIYVWMMIAVAGTMLSYVLSVGCSVKLTPMQQTLWALNVYKAQYDLYLEQVINPDVTPEIKAQLKKDPALIKGKYINPDISDDQWEVLKVKQRILNELKPLVAMAANYHQAGELPPAEVQKQITDLINDLIALID